MPKYRRCWVPNCHNTKRANAEKSKLFSFPSDLGRCMNWLMAIGDPTLAVCPLQTLISSRFVCVEHFTPRMLTAAGRAGWNAVPVLFSDVRPELQEEALRTFLEGLPPGRRPAPPSLNVTVNISSNVVAFPDSSPPAGGERTQPVEGEFASHTFPCAGEQSRASVGKSSSHLYSDIAVPVGTSLPGKNAGNFISRSRLGKPKSSEALSDVPAQKQTCGSSGSSVTESRRNILMEAGHPNAVISPVKGKLLSVAVKLKRKIKKLQKENDHLAALTRTKNLDVMLQGVVSPDLLSIIRGNLRNFQREGKGRRWTQQAKVMALSIFKRSPRAYRLLCCYLTLHFF